MDRSERLSTSVTEDTKQRFRVRAAEQGMTMSEYLRELVLEDVGEDEEGNPSPRMEAAPTAD